MALPQGTTVSAVIATFNRAPELREALSRLLAQSHPVAEILVVDDGSTDGERNSPASATSACRTTPA